MSLKLGLFIVKVWVID